MSFEESSPQSSRLTPQNSISMKTRILFTLTAFVLFATELVMAQPGLPSAPSQAPIDGGLSLLAAAGGAYAIKKLRDKKKKNEEDNIDM